MFRFIAIANLLFLFAACGGQSTKQPASTEASDNSMNGNTKSTAAIKVAPEQLATLKDVVCGMSVPLDAIADTAVVAGRVYPFCATECKKTFLADVAKYKIN